MRNLGFRIAEPIYPRTLDCNWEMPISQIILIISDSSCNLPHVSQGSHTLYLISLDKQLPIIVYKGVRAALRVHGGEVGVVVVVHLVRMDTWHG